MKITYVGQAGWLFETARVKILIDPYFSDSVRRLHDTSYRRVPMQEAFWHCEPDVIVCTHNHLDHYDPDTMEPLLKGAKPTVVLGPSSVWQVARQLGGPHNYVWFNRHTRWTQGDVTLTAVKAEHSDPDAIGVLIDDGKDVYYVTGDTLYNTDILADLPQGIKAVFVPMNGAGNNMNATDAMAFAAATGARYAVPCHVGMLDDLTNAAFDTPNTVRPTIWEELKLD